MNSKKKKKLQRKSNFFFSQKEYRNVLFLFSHTNSFGVKVSCLYYKTVVTKSPEESLKIKTKQFLFKN